MTDSETTAHDVGEPLLLIPGQLCTGVLWHAAVSCLARAAPVQVAEPPSVERIRTAAAQLLDNAPSRFALAGHAMGGFVALEMIHQAPARVTRLALLNTLAPPDFAPQRARRRSYSMLVAQGAFDAVVEERIPMLLHPGRRDDPALLAAVRRMARETGADRFLAQQEGILHRADARPWLPDINCPTLIVGSRDDAIVPAREITLLATGIPGAELEWLDVCGHLSPLEQPRAVARALATWLERPLR